MKLKKSSILLYTLIAIVISSVAIAVAVTYLQETTRIPSSGEVKIKTLNCETDTPNISWGTLHPNDIANTAIQIRITGNVNATLSMTTENWTSSLAKQYLTLSWNYDDSMLTPNVWIDVTLTLSVAFDIHDVNTFGFEIVIIATET